MTGPDCTAMKITRMCEMRVIEKVDCRETGSSTGGGGSKSLQPFTPRPSGQLHANLRRFSADKNQIDSEVIAWENEGLCPNLI